MAKSKTAVRILLADGHTIFREGLNRLLAGQPDTRVVGETGDGAEVCRLAAKLKPDILLLDHRIPKAGVAEILRSPAKTANGARIVLLCGEIQPEEISRCFESGIRGFVMKDSAVGMLIRCIRAV